MSAENPASDAGLEYSDSVDWSQDPVKVTAVLRITVDPMMAPYVMSQLGQVMQTRFASLPYQWSLEP